MKMIFRIAAAVIVLASTNLPIYAQQNVLSIIPKPVKVETNNTPVVLNASSSILYDAGLEKQAQYLQQQVFNQCGLQLSLSPKKGSFIVLRLGNSLNKAESYLLRTVKDSILIEGADSKGVVNGIQTLLQLLPLNATKQVRVPGVNIIDYPAFPYRGSTWMWCGISFL